MEIIGNDKKLRALFSEAQRADEAATPSFTSVWHRAQARSLKPRRAFNFSFAVVTALLVLTIGSLAVWSMYSSRRDRKDEAVTHTPASHGPAPAPATPPANANNEDGSNIAMRSPQAPITTPVHRSVKPRVKRSTANDAALIAANGKSKAAETTIDSWQSPTAALLTSQIGRAHV